MKSLLIVFSYDHGNTEKIAGVSPEFLKLKNQGAQADKSSGTPGVCLIGFGSGIYDAKHHTDLLDLADALPQVTNKKAFIFSTSSMTSTAQVAEDHSTLRDKLQSKGYSVVDEFCCKGFNTNSFLRHFGGINKGRPNAEDLRHAEKFATNLRQNTHAT